MFIPDGSASIFEIISGECNSRKCPQSSPNNNNNNKNIFIFLKKLFYQSKALNVCFKFNLF